MLIEYPNSMYVDSIKFVGNMYRIGDKGVTHIEVTMKGNAKVYYEIGTYISLSANGIEQINIRKYA
ncbi:hypothetical protein 8014-B2_0077 [Lactobacillus phage ATCC 8014-B2]|uniref:Uncharacterized protein n=1 Tax=Lactobacillus phage ATCC 8014-B2 TaxID=1225795 RepID=K4ID85_9CAUD|nr:hypothetical protein HOQ89_gp069 [Lactobacillus phage ATCC 8014-B2]AFU63144.1 hypothetical protein 8014-B2_0077 [Lactobacillus phage ATCC 8014-B2]